MVPRSSHGEWTPPTGRPDPVSILEGQAATRVAELIPLRYERMLASPFAFYRGAAAVMAVDLSQTPNSGLRVQCCGDAHLANFGGFESPERAMLFDINDFDETLPGPWEWDVKRLVASLVVAARNHGFDDYVGSRAVMTTVSAYRQAMRTFSTQRNLDVWYARLDMQAMLDEWRKIVSPREVRRVQRNIDRAEGRDSLRAFAKLTERTPDGRVQIRNDPPLVVGLEDVYAEAQVDLVFRQLSGWLESYRRTLQPNRRRLLDGFQIVDAARKVVGVGSVGTRCWIALLMGRDDTDPLFLQVKEAEASVLEQFAGKSKCAQHGQRVVEGQRLMQASSDIFLGWDRWEAPDDGSTRHFYVRQLWDGKYSADLTAMSATLLPLYGQMCGWTLARAHARSGDRIAIAAYLGGSDVFDRAMVDFAVAYAAQNARDFEETTAAARAGQLPISTAADAPDHSVSGRAQSG
jgi:uncharacterized protein (DUF2252 family)